MKNKLLVFLTLDQKNQAREKLIAKSQKDGTFEKWSDGAVETKDYLYVLKVVAVTFPTQEFAGFDEVEAPDVLKELKRFVFELEQCIGTVNEMAPEDTESTDSDKNGEDDRNDGESGKSPETDINDENNRE